MPAQGTPREFIDGVPAGAGLRVPAIIVSPWTAGGWVCSQPFDPTSVLQFLERVTGVRGPNISEWRRATFGDLTAALHFDRPASAAPSLPDAQATLAAVHAHLARLPTPTLPEAEQTPPSQEKSVLQRRG